MWYSIKKDNYNIVITKKESNSQNLEVWFTKYRQCGLEKNSEKLWLKSGLNEVSISLPNPTTTREDDSVYGLYKLHIKLGNQEDEKIIPYYPHVLKNLIEDLERVLCNCGCSNCPDCIEEATLLDITFKTIFYYSLSGNTYSVAFANALKCIDCDLDKEAICLLLTERIYGNRKNTRFLKKLLSIFYLSFYFTENFSDCHKTYTNNLFNISAIQDCLALFDVDYQCVKESIQKGLCYSEAGDYTAVLDNRGSMTFTKGHFTNLVYPKFYTTSCGEIESIRIDKLDIKGTLTLNDVPVTVNQIIKMSDIASGKLVFIGQDTNDVTVSTIHWSYLNPCTGEYVSYNQLKTLF